MEGPNSELDSFRKQWHAEVSGRAQPAQSSKVRPAAGPSRHSGHQTHLVPPAVKKPLPQNNNVEESDSEDERENYTKQALLSDDIEGFESRAAAEPQSALEHYEKAVEKENQGNLGDSLDLYRKAFKVSSITWQLDQC